MNKTAFDFKPNKACFHPNKAECKLKIKKAHSLQKNGVLNLIEENYNGNNQIISFDSFRRNMRGEVIDFKPQGKAEASTFFGFCDYHDSHTFSKIENFPFKETEEQLFLHTYRAFAHSFHRKGELTLYHQGIHDEIGPQLFNVSRLTSESRSLAQLSSYKAFIDNCLINSKYSEFDYLVHVIDRQIPVACSSLFAPRCTFRGKIINTFKPEDTLKGLTALTVFPTTENKTYIILSALKMDRLAIELIDELDSLSDVNFEKVVSSLMVEYAENVHVAPSVINQLSSFKKRQLIKEINLCVPADYGKRAHNGFFLSKINFF